MIVEHEITPDLSTCTTLWFLDGEGVFVGKRRLTEILVIRDALAGTNSALKLRVTRRSRVGNRKYGRWKVDFTLEVKDNVAGANTEPDTDMRQDVQGNSVPPCS